jgi:hypothetical protein
VTLIGTACTSPWQTKLSGTVPQNTSVSDPDPDPGGQKLPTRVENNQEEISCLEVLDVLF